MSTAGLYLTPPEHSITSPDTRWERCGYLFPPVSGGSAFGPWSPYGWATAAGGLGGGQTKIRIR